MAESSKDGRVTKVLLRQVETSEECSVQLDVDPETIVDGGGEVITNTSFGFVQHCVETDQDLSDQAREKLSFVPKHLEESTEEEESPNAESNVDKLVTMLKECAEDIKDKMKKDPKICSICNNILSDCVKKKESEVDETDSEEMAHLAVDWSKLWSYISQVFQRFFADLNSPDVDAITVLVNLGTALAFCYHLVKQIIVTYVESTTFKDYVYLLCKVISLLFRHLVIIQFGSILQKIGGWNTLLSMSVDQTTKALTRRAARYIPLEYLFLAIGMASIGIFTYLKFFKR